MYRILLSLSFSLLVLSVAFAQAPKKMTSSDIHDEIKRLNVLASALYLAAHPDDENTRLIAWLANEKRANTAYLSMTRGDGGQNLIGPEIRELLGVIRTQELLAARRVDGGKQMFTRANDFGYSKHPDETFKIWNKDEVLADVVWAIRKFQPDIIVNRFDHRTPGRTHGHHTGSAMLSMEAFDMINDPNAYPEQLKYLKPWQPQRLFFNTSWWFYGSRENFANADKSRMISVDVGAYYPLKGKSNTEIASLSRSMHRCQGFGSTGTRGNMQEYMELLKGDMPTTKDDPFAGINTTWTRVKGGAPIGELMAKIDNEFRHDNPSASVTDLLKAYQMIKALPDGHWKEIKLKDIKTVIAACMGLYLETVASEASVTPGDELTMDMELINRSDVKAILTRMSLLPMNVDTVLEHSLSNNESFKLEQTIQLPTDLKMTNAYWLEKDWAEGMYTVENQLMRGLPESPRVLKMVYELSIQDVPMTFEMDVVYKKNDPVMGETYRPLEVTPPVYANIAEKVYVFANNEPRTVEVIVKSGKANINGVVKLQHPKSWRVEPAEIPFDLGIKGAEARMQFQVFPPENQEEAQLNAVVEIDGQQYGHEVVFIEYDHIPAQTILREAKAKIVRIDLQRLGQNIGYIMGAGDDIPTSLTQIGYDVTLLDPKSISVSTLNRFDAVILGIRAFNTVDRLKFLNADLMEYVEKGGTLIVQYNTAHRLVTKDLAPYPLKLSRDRVTMEDAEVRLLAPTHRVLTHPNKITEKDFDGWVQERGLYFPNEWDEKYTPILSANDPGEDPKNGGLLVARHGKGYYIYSGYSWFRELPAGVPGAYRLFTNMISIGVNP